MIFELIFIEIVIVEVDKFSIYLGVFINNRKYGLFVKNVYDEIVFFFNVFF